MAPLSEDEVSAALSEYDDWEQAVSYLRKKVKFAKFADGVAAVAKVAEKADAANHHPDIEIHSDEVTFTLSTHSEGGITQKDLDLAKEIDGIVKDQKS